jgi:2-oxoisovalerate dehydrogenase E2 component (dihydrolipoyl transacylase)
MNIFNLPDLGEGLPDAEIVEWHVKEGDTVKVDDLLVSMETAKAVVEVPSPYAGKIVRLHGQAGDIILTGAPLVSFEVLKPSSTTQIEALSEASTVAGKIEVGNTVLQEAAMGITPIKIGSTQIKALPAVRALAKLLEIDLVTVEPTGPQGEITLADLKGKTAHCTFSSSLEGGQVEAVRGTRRAMAQIMSASHAEVVPVSVFDDANIQAWSANTDITYRVIRAIAVACQAEPAVNVHFNKKTLERTLFTEVNIGIAMDSTEGLFVPVLKSAQTLTAPEVRSKINHFKQIVKDRTISASDLQGSTIQLSNFGTFAGRYATPIVVPPNVAIIGTGKIREQATTANGAIVMNKFMPLSLSVDHRAVTGGEATRFLKALIEDLQQVV